MFITQWFPPEPVQQPLWIAHALRDEGFDIQVLTGIPNYPSGVVPPGYSAVKPMSDQVDDLPVHRTPLYPSHDERAARRILNYLSWAITSSVLGIRRLRKADVALVYSSPATAAMPALLAKWLWRVPYVLLIQDVWPDSIFSSGFLRGIGRRSIERILHGFVNVTYRNAEHIAVISPGMVELLRSRGVPESKLSVVYNWVSEGDEVVGELTRGDLGLRDDDFVMMYAGNHGAAQSLSTLVRAMAEVPESASCRLLMVGDGVEKSYLQDIANQVAPGRVQFLAPQPRAAMPSLMRLADAQVVSLADEGLFAVTMPSKVQSILQAGYPMIAIAAGDVADVVRDAGAGVTAVPGDVSSVVTAILAIARREKQELLAAGQRARSYYDANMSQAVGAQRLAAIIEAAQRGSRS